MRRSSWTTSRVITKTWWSESQACATRLFSLRTVSVAWRMPSRSWERIPEPQTLRVSLPHAKLQRPTIKSLLSSASMRKVKRPSRLTSSVYRSSSRRRTKTLSTTTKVFHARWRPNKAKDQSKNSPTQSRSWLSGWTQQSTRTLRRSACWTSMWGTQRLFKKPLRRSWRLRE